MEREVKEKETVRFFPLRIHLSHFHWSLTFFPLVPYFLSVSPDSRPFSVSARTRNLPWISYHGLLPKPKMDFDEDNYECMENVANSIKTLVPRTFRFGDEKFLLNCKTVAELDTPDLQLFVSTIDKCMGAMYVKHKGKNWQEEKFEELAEEGLVFVWLSEQNSDETSEMCGFLAFKLALELYGKTLYLYEIQISPRFQEIGLGRKLMLSFHELAKLLDASVGNLEISYSSLPSTKYTSLTVFSDNTRALNWYQRLGYDFTDDSPRDRELRGGKVKRPSYYLLARPIQ